MRISTVLPLIALSALACRGADGTVSSTESLAEGDANCAAGGVAIYFGIDDDRDGSLSEEERDGSPIYVCNGTNGADGENGTNGTDGVDAGAVQLITTDTTWSADTTIDVPVIVMSGATLTVASGIGIEILPGGSLHVEGTILFEGDSTTPAATIRYGLPFATGVGNVFVTGDSDASQLDYVTFDDVGLILEGAATDSLTGATFNDSTLQIWGRTGAITVSDSTFNESPEFFGIQLLVRDVPSLTVTGVDFTGGGTGLQFEPVQDSALTVQNSTFTGVGNGISTGAFDTTSRIDADFNDLTFQDIGIRGIVMDRTDLTLSDATFNTISLEAIQGDNTVSATLDGLIIDDASGDCINVTGPLVVTDSTLTNCSFEGIQGGSELTVSSTSVTNARYGIWYDFQETDFETPLVDISNVTINDTVHRGLHIANYLGNTTITDTTVTGAALNECVWITGSADLDGVTVSDCAADGIEVDRGGTATNINATDVFADGLRFDAWDADVTIDGVTVDGAGVFGVVVATGANVSVTDVNVTNTGNHGVLLASTGTMAVDNANVSDVGGRGLQVSTATGSTTITNVAIANTGDDGLYSAGELTSIDGALVASAGLEGIEVRAAGSTITNARVQDSGNYGVWMTQGGNLTQSVVSGSADWQVYIDGFDENLIDACDIIDGLSFGIVGRYQGGNRPGGQLSVTNSNITGNAEKATSHVMAVDSNYTANNNGLTTVDVEEEGNLDGVFNTDTEQHEDADVILSPASEAVTGTGPQN